MNRVAITFFIIELAVLIAYYFFLNNYLMKWLSKSNFLFYVVVVLGAYFITKFTWLGTKYFVSKILL